MISDQRNSGIRTAITGIAIFQKLDADQTRLVLVAIINKDGSQEITIVVDRPEVYEIHSLKYGQLKLKHGNNRFSQSNQSTTSRVRISQ